MSAATYRRRRLVVGLVAATLVVVLTVVGYAVWQVVSLGLGIQRSDVISGRSSGDGTDILLMGLDSRLDVRGRPLSPEIYEALHSGDASDGGLNANVLMYLHISPDGSAVSAFSIPRDDYVDLVGCPAGVCKGKIKSAYGLAFDAESRRLVQTGVSGEDLHVRSRDVARAAQISTVEQFLDVRIDHFVEVTMVSFFEIAQVVQPVTVCVKQDTVDTYSGADFRAGEQQISAEQAVAFVRQRRDTSNPNLAFTDLDRSRRQQAFIVSLLTQLKGSQTLTNPGRLSGIVDVAKRNTAIDTGLDPFALARMAQALRGGDLSFYTLPVERFDRVDGQDVNVVDTAKVRAMVKDLTSPPPAQEPAQQPATPTLDGAGRTLDVVNASGVTGAAKALQEGLVGHGFVAGDTGNGPPRTDSEVTHAPGAATDASALAAYLGGLAVREDPSLPAGHVAVVIGADFTAPPGMAPAASPTAGGATVDEPVDATGGGASGPPPTALTELAGEGVPCVK